MMRAVIPCGNSLHVNTLLLQFCHRRWLHGNPCLTFVPPWDLWLSLFSIAASLGSVSSACFGKLFWLFGIHAERARLIFFLLGFVIGDFVLCGNKEIGESLAVPASPSFLSSGCHCGSVLPVLGTAHCNIKLYKLHAKQKCVWYKVLQTHFWALIVVAVLTIHDRVDFLSCGWLP